MAKGKNLWVVQRKIWQSSIITHIAIDESSKLQLALQRMNTLKDILAKQKQITILGPNQIAEANTAINKLNASLKSLGLKPIKLDTQNLTQLNKELEKIKAKATAQVRELISNMQAELRKFTVEFRIEGLKSDQAQTLQEITDNLKVLGEQEARNIDTKKAHTDRIQQMQNVLNTTKQPQKQAVQFLEDEMRIRRQNIQELEKEMQQNKLDNSLMIRRNVEQNKMNQATRLYALLNQQANLTDKQKAEVFAELTRYLKDMSDALGKTSGRYRGLTQAVGGLVSDIKNLIKVQIRWYATQALIFKSVQGIKDAVSFYVDLETQVARVTSVLAQEYDLTTNIAKVTALLRREMVRTGQSAENLATTLWELVSAGLAHNEAMAGLEHITNLSVAAELELSETTRITAGLFRVFGDEIEGAATASDKFRVIVDSLAGTLNQSQVDMDGLIAGLGYLINESDAAGLSMNQVLGILSVLNNRLLLGSKAGRSASRVLTQLTGNADKLAESFDLKIDPNKPLDLIDILEQLNVKINALKVDGKITVDTFAKLQDIFGQVGKRAAIGLIENIDELKNSVEDLDTGKFAGLAEEMAEVKLGTMSREMSRLSNAFKIFLSDALSPVITAMRGLLDIGLLVTRSLSKGLEGAQKSWVYTSLAATALFGTLQGVATWLGPLHKQWLVTGNALALVGTAAVVAAKGLAKVLIQLTFIIPIITGLIKKYKEFTLMQLVLGETIKIATGGILASATALTVIGGIIIAAILALYSYQKAVTKTRNVLKEANAELSKSKDAYTEASDKMAATVKHVNSLGEQYKKAIPYTTEWYNLRARISAQYPTLLEDMDTEIVTLGKIDHALESAIEKEKERLGLLYKRQAFEADIERTSAAAEQRAEALQQKISKVTTGSRWFPDYQYKQATSELNTEMEEFAKRVEQVGVEHVKIGPKLRQLLQMMTGFDPQIDRMASLRDRFREMGEEGGKATDGVRELKLEVDKLTKGTANDTTTIDIETNLGDIDPKAMEQVVNKLRNQINDLGKKAFKDVTIFQNMSKNFDEFLRKYYSQWGRVKVETKESLAQMNSDLVTEANSFKKLSSELPEDLKEKLKNIGYDLDNTFKKAVDSAIETARMHGTEADKMRAAFALMATEADRAEEAINALLSGSFQGTVRQIENLFRKFGSGSDTGFREAINFQFKTMADAQVEAFKAGLGKESRAIFENWLTSTGEMTGETYKKVAESVFAFVTKLNGALTVQSYDTMKALLAFDKQSTSMAENIVTVESLLLKMGGSVSDAMGAFIKANDDLLKKSAEALPEYINNAINSASQLEKVQILKILKETKKEIEDEATKLGVPLTDGLVRTLTTAKLKGKYDEILDITGRFYEKALEFSADYADELIKSNAELDQSYSTLGENRLKYKKEEYELTTQYNNDMKELENELKEIREAAYTEEESKNIKILNAELAKNKEAVERATTAMTRAATAIKQLGKATKNFNDFIFSDKGRGRLTDILTNFKDQLATFLDKGQTDIDAAYTQFLRGIQAENRTFIMSIVNQAVNVAGMTSEEAKLMILEMLTFIKDKGGVEDLDETLKDFADIMQLAYTRGAEKRAVAMGEQQDILEKLQNQEKAINDGRLENSKEFLRKQAEIDLRQLEYFIDINSRKLEMQSEYYKETDNKRKQELTNINEFESQFKDVLSGTDLKTNLKRRFEIMREGYDAESTYLNQKLGTYEEALALHYKKLNSLTTKYTTTQADPLGRLSETDTERLDHIKQNETAYEAIRTNALAEQARIDKEASDTSRSYTANDIQKREADIAAFKSMEAGAVASLKELGEEKQAILNTDNKVMAEAYRQEIGIINLNIQNLQGIRTGLRNQLEALPKEAAIEMAALGKAAAEAMSAGAQDTLNNRILSMTSMLKVEGAGTEALAFIDTNKIANEIKSELETTRDKLKESFRVFLQNLFDTEQITAPQFKEYMARVSTSLDESFAAETVGLREKFQDGIRTELEGADLSEATEGLFKVDLRLLQRAGGSLEQHRTLLDNISEIDNKRLTMQKASLQGLQAETTSLIRNLALKKEDLKQATLANAAAVEALVAAEASGNIGEIVIALEKAHAAARKLEDASADVKSNELAVAKSIEEQEKILKRVLTIEQRLATVTALTMKNWDEFLEGFKYGIRTTWETWSEEATNASKIAGELLTGLMNGMSSTIMNTMEAMFMPPEEEIDAAEKEMKDLLDERSRIKKEIDDIMVGGPSGQEEELKSLQEEWKKINKEIKISSDNLNELGDTSKRVANAWKQFGSDMLKMLSELILKLTLTLIISKLLKSALSFGGDSDTSLGDAVGGRGVALEGEPLDWAKGGYVPGGFIPILKKYAKGGVIKGGLQLPEKGRQDWLNYVKYNMGATLLAGGGIIGSPTLGLVGEGRQNEAVVPLPDNRSIPVKFTGDEGRRTQDVKIMNIVDPQMIPSVMMQNPDIIINVISEDISKRGPMFHLIKQVK